MSAGPHRLPRRAVAAWLLVVSVGLTILLFVMPFGRILARPLLLLSTLAHELGHGLAAVLAGGRFEMLAMWSDGSGAAHYSGGFGRVGTAFVAAGGLLGPALAAALGFVAGRAPRTARAGLLGMGLALLLAEVMVVRTLFGVLFVAVVAVALIAVGWLARPVAAQLAMVFLATQLALSVFSRGDYLFTRTALTAAGPMPSDTARMAAALLLPYWFWGGVCAVVSLLVLVAGLVAFVRSAAAG